MHNPQSVVGVLFSEDRSRVLLIQRRDVPVWVLPGGGIEPGEPSESAIIREMLEETGFEVKVVRLVGKYTPVNRLAKRTLLYEVARVGGSATLGDETRGIRFVSAESLPPLTPPYDMWIRHAVAQGPLVEECLTQVNYRVLLRFALRHPVLVLRFLLARLGCPINS